jgi:hypothetical protein
MGAKGLCLCGLYGAERQVGSTRWTRWSKRTSVGRIVARKARRSCEHELVQGSGSQLESAHEVWLIYSIKPTPSRDDRGSQVMSGIGVRAAPSLCSLRQFTTKLSGSSVEPQSQDQRLTGQRQDLGAPRDFEVENMRWDRKACVEAKRDAIAGRPSDGATTRIPKVPFGGMYPIMYRGSFVFRLPPYKLRRERMAVISWNSSSFAFLFSLPIFLRIFYRTSLRASW